MVRDGLGVDAWFLAQAKDEPANSSMIIIPAVIEAYKSDDEG
jgi:hypothetical protein